MSKVDELKKKLEKQAEKNCVLNDRTHVDCFVSGYLKGSLPREKRIAELENKIADIKANCDLAIEGRDVKIRELEADNDAKTFAMAMSEKVEKHLRKENTDQKDQLEKAKELIEDMYDKIPASHSDYYKDVMERARQFLKEIEK